MKKIDHPDILKFYKAKKEGKVYLVLEYCNGDLSKYIS